MKYFLYKKDPTYIFLGLILILAGILRFYGLSNQSLWVDELHTVIEADPALPLSSLFEYLKCCDIQPPLFYLLERVLFSIFGQTEGVARSLSATCGLVSVWAMYLMGKELMDKKLGLIAALITTVNYFNIEYSQEARNYAMAMLFTILSFLFFIKIIKDPRYKRILLYVLFSLLLLYTHYYSLFIVASQGLTALVFIIGDKTNRRQYFRVFAVSGFLIALGYLPWLPALLITANITTVWIPPVSPNFVITFFFDYFGNYRVIGYSLVVLLIFFFWQVGKQRNWSLDKVRESPIQLTFLVFGMAILVTYLISYLRSVLVVPMLLNRYTIVVIPGYILFLSFALARIRYGVIQIVSLALFVIMTLWYMIMVNQYYKIISKTQFREMTEFISQYPGQKYPIVEELTDWQHAYYLKKFHVDVPVLTGRKIVTLDSILNRRSAKYDLQGFWIAGAHGSSYLDSATRAALDTAYQLVVQQDYYDAWCQLYVKYKSKNKDDRPRDVTRYFNGEIPMTIWQNGTIESKPIPVLPGKYRAVFIVKGSRAGNEFAHVNLYLGNQKMSDFFTTGNYEEKSFGFEVMENSEVVLKIEFTNDDFIDGHDRNAYLQRVSFEKVVN